MHKGERSVRTVLITNGKDSHKRTKVWCDSDDDGIRSSSIDPGNTF
jgi:hypothetical protein